jgi:hypothetical protein
MPWSQKGRAIPILPLWAVQPVESLSACTRVHVTFTFLPIKTSDLSWSYPASYSVGKDGSLLRVKGGILSVVEVKN